MKMMLKIRNVQPNWASTDGRVCYYPAAKEKEPAGEFPDSHSGWIYYSGFGKVKARKILVTNAGLPGEEYNVCHIEQFHGNCAEDSTFAVLKILAGERIGEESIIILTNTEVYLLNEQGQTIERLW